MSEVHENLLVGSEALSGLVGIYAGPTNLFYRDPGTAGQWVSDGVATYTVPAGDTGGFFIPLPGHIASGETPQTGDQLTFSFDLMTGDADQLDEVVSEYEGSRTIYRKIEPAISDGVWSRVSYAFSRAESDDTCNLYILAKSDCGYSIRHPKLERGMVATEWTPAVSEGGVSMIMARGQVTLAVAVDVSSVTRWYLLQASTLTAPAKPTAKPPGGSWSATEPTYTEGSTNSLYTCDLTTFSDGTFAYSSVSLSSSYEAAKAAYNKAVAAANTAAATDQHFWADTDGAHVSSTGDHDTSGFHQLMTSVKNAFMHGSTELMTISENLIELGKNSPTAEVNLCGNEAIIACRDILGTGKYYDVHMSSPEGAYLMARGEGGADEAWAGVVGYNAAGGKNGSEFVFDVDNIGFGGGSSYPLDNLRYVISTPTTATSAATSTMGAMTWRVVTLAGGMKLAFGCGSVSTSSSGTIDSSIRYSQCTVDLPSGVFSSAPIAAFGQATNLAAFSPSGQASWTKDVIKMDCWHAWTSGGLSADMAYVLVVGA